MKKKKQVHIKCYNQWDRMKDKVEQHHTSPFKIFSLHFLHPAREVCDTSIPYSSLALPPLLAVLVLVVLFPAPDSTYCLIFCWSSQRSDSKPSTSSALAKPRDKKKKVDSWTVLISQQSSIGFTYDLICLVFLSIQEAWCHICVRTIKVHRG